jgi:hypothetical protein
MSNLNAVEYPPILISVEYPNIMDNKKKQVYFQKYFQLKL